MSRKVSFDTEKAMELLNEGIKQKDIAKELNIKIGTLGMWSTRNARKVSKEVKEQKIRETKEDE